MEGSWLTTTNSFKAKIIGKLLGDGSITKQENRKPRFQFIHAKPDLGWSYYCYQQLKDYLPLNPPKYKINIDPRLKQGFSECHYVQSRTSDVITYLHSKWYPQKSKVIPFDLIRKFFNAESLAWWYMDDGHLKTENNTPRKIILSTDSFSKMENKWLINFLHRKYNLLFRIDKQNRIILYDQFQIHYFLHLVTPFLHESMHRKFITSYNYFHQLPAKRTTIYLLSDIRIKFPTREINHALNNLDSLIRQYKSGIFFDNFFPNKLHQDKAESKSYQIVINELHISKLYFLTKVTGLNYSRLAEICYKLN